MGSQKEYEEELCVSVGKPENSISQTGEDLDQMIEDDQF